MTDPTDSEFSELEAELAALKPAPPSRRLHSAIALGLSPCVRSKQRIGPSYGLAWAGGSLLAAAAIAILVSLRRPPEPALDFKPVSAQDIVTAVRDEGVVTLPDGTAARQIDASVLETLTWKDEAAHATLSWSIPEEQVRIIPVSYE